MKTQNKNLRRRWLLVSLLALTLVYYVQVQKDLLARETLTLLERSISRETGMDIRVGRVSGKILGSLVLHDVVIEDPSREPEERLLFQAKKIKLRYRLLDLFSKKFSSRLEIQADSPQFYLRVSSAPRLRALPMVSWIRSWIHTSHRNLDVSLKNMDWHLTQRKLVLKGVSFEFKKNAYRLEVPVQHAAFGAADVSTVLRLEGNLGEDLEGNFVSGRISTQGTVINWTPLPYESSVDFALSEKFLRIMSADILGGIWMSGEIDLKKGFEIDLTVKTENYPVKKWEPFLKTVHTLVLPERLDFEASIYGDPLAPHGSARLRVFDGWIRGHAFKAMEMGLEMVYPTARLVDSRILLEDGSAMRFADMVVEFSELFQNATYRKLFSTAAEDNVVMGDWAFRKSSGIQNEQEILMQKAIGPNTQVNLRKFDEDKLVTSNEPRDVEVGFEYRIRSEDSLKLEFRDQEQIVGVEHKTQF